MLSPFTFMSSVATTANEGACFYFNDFLLHLRVPGDLLPTKGRRNVSGQIDVALAVMEIDPA